MRMYDPRVGRFPNVDPLTKKYPELTPYQFASNSPISGIDLDGLEYYFSVKGKLLGKIGNSTEVYTADNIINNKVQNAKKLGISIKDFVDRTHMTYGEGGSTDVYTIQNGTPKDSKDDITINPAQYFADAIQNGVEHFGGEEEMKNGEWLISSKISYAKGNIQTHGHNNPPADVSAYNVFNDARKKFEGGDLKAFDSPLFERNFEATIHAILNKDKPDLVDGAAFWVSGGDGSTWNSKMDKRDPTVKISNSTRWWKNFTTFYKDIKNSTENDKKRTDLTVETDKTKL